MPNEAKEVLKQMNEAIVKPLAMPTPWTISANEPTMKQFGKLTTFEIGGANSVIWNAQVLEKEDAELIVRAVNSYEDMRGALVQADLQIEYMQSKFKETGSGNSVRAQIQAALKKARG